ncbi:ribonuclease PH [Synechococcus sp. H65.1]|uniref:ribonuclease PH n=1 Tax=unclassified Synechococcus TaxID=2626047 RepID=UPI0039C17145
MSWQRPDGRTAAQLRPISFQRHFTRYAPGSVLVKFGDTHVLCTATVAEEVPPFLQNTGQGWLTAEYRLLPTATQQRQPREVLKLSGRTAEIQRLIGRSLRAALDLQKLGSRTITIDADVLQADGSTRTAAITGGYVALHDAITWLYKQGLLDPAQGSPLRQQVAALSVGIVQGEVLLDLCYEEDSQAEVDMNVVMNEQGALIEIQGTAEASCFDRSQLLQMLDLAQAGIQKLLQAQRDALNS